jgi:hypothetical protein
LRASICVLAAWRKTLTSPGTHSRASSALCAIKANPGKSARQGREPSRNRTAHSRFCPFRTSSCHACPTAAFFQALSVRAFTFNFQSKIPALAGLLIEHPDRVGTVNLPRPPGRSRPPHSIAVQHLRRHTVSSTPLFSFACAIIRINVSSLQILVL